MRIVDLTATLRTGLPIYPGDPPVEVAPACTVETDGFAVARLALSDQAGTHVETQAHFLAGGRTLDQEPLARFIGAASVVNVPCGPITVGDLEPATARLTRTRRVLLRSGYRPRGGIDPHDPARPRLGLPALRWLVDRRLELLGIDAFDFDGAPDYAGHRLLLAHDVLIVEGLVGLEALPAGDVMLYVVPLRLEGTGAAPCRAFALLD
jgi:kynurenine formamidase